MSNDHEAIARADLTEVLKRATEVISSDSELVNFKTVLQRQLSENPAMDVLRKRMEAKREEVNQYMSLANEIEGRMNNRDLQIQLLQNDNEEDDRQRRAVEVLQRSARNEVTTLENAIQDFRS